MLMASASLQARHNTTTFGRKLAQKRKRETPFQEPLSGIFSGFICRDILHQFADLYIQIAAEFADKLCIDPLKLIIAVSVKIRSGNVQCLADFVLGDTLFLQNLLNMKDQFSVLHWVTPSLL